jgi:hypothetical protein
MSPRDIERGGLDRDAPDDDWRPGDSADLEGWLLEAEARQPQTPDELAELVLHHRIPAYHRPQGAQHAQVT